MISNFFTPQNFGEKGGKNPKNYDKDVIVPKAHINCRINFRIDDKFHSHLPFPHTNSSLEDGVGMTKDKNKEENFKIIFSPQQTFFFFFLSSSSFCH